MKPKRSLLGAAQEKLYRTDLHLSGGLKENNKGIRRLGTIRFHIIVILTRLF